MLTASNVGFKTSKALCLLSYEDPYLGHEECNTGMEGIWGPPLANEALSLSTPNHNGKYCTDC